MEVEAYSRRYAKAFRDYYMDFDIEVDSLGALRYVLTQLTLPSSQFMDVLLTVRDNTALDPGENEYLRPLAMRLAEFEFFRRLLEEQKGAFPELDKYKALLEQMQMDIQEDGPVPDADEKDPLEGFKTRLTPLARISFDIFRDGPDSYLSLAKLWLKSVGVSPQWQDVFLAPIYQAYSLGMKEMEEGIDKTWVDLHQVNISPFYHKFPFDRISDNDISYEELKEATHPYGQFWKTFNGSLTPFCVEEGGRWRARVCPLGVPKLPDNMLPTVNAVSRLSSGLWNNEGEAKPLEFMIKPVPLPQAGESKPITILSYLQAGASSVFGFNQQAAWKKFTFKWHDTSTASVGVEFTTQDGSERLQNTIMVPNAPWSFYRLLQKTEDFAVLSKFSESPEEAGTVLGGSGDRGNQLTWPIDCPQIKESGEPSVLKIKYDIQNNPWALFKMPR
jgi:type VI protein secretion system component VasK